MEQIPQNEEKEQPILSFEEFSTIEKGMPRYNNFFMFFIQTANIDSQWRREKIFFKKLVESNPDLVSTIENELAKIKEEKIWNKNRVKALAPLNEKFYQAYIIMRKYGATNKELSCE